MSLRLSFCVLLFGPFIADICDMKQKRKICCICRRKRVMSRLKRMESGLWACTDGAPEPCVSHPDFTILKQMKVLQKRLKCLKTRI